MKTTAFLIISFLLINVNIFAQDSTETRSFEPAAMQQDFNFLRKTLEDTHPGLYMHQTKKQMQHTMDSLYALLNKPMIFFDFYKIIAYLIAEVKCEHTNTIPYKGTFNKHALEWKIIPFQLYFTGNKAYVTVNRTADSSVHLGDEVLTINNYPVDSLKRVIYQYLPSDGNMESGKEQAISSTTFNLCYYQFIERPEVYNITFKNAAGQVFSRRYDTKLSMKENGSLTMQNPANAEILALDKKNQAIRKTQLKLELLKEKNTAILTIRAFDGDRKKMFEFYDKSFTTLQNEKIGNLIVDLSNNDGGDEEFACELLSYFISSPTRFIKHEYLINADSSYLALSDFPKEVQNNKYDYIDSLKDGKYMAKELTKYSLELKTFDPKPNRFMGNVYFYVTGVTASAASTCSANAKTHKLAIIVGNETAGSFAGGGATNGLNLTLPNSKIFAHTAIVYSKFNTSGGDKDRGVIPDHYYIPTFNELITGNTGWRDYIDSLINKK